jgi:uncharacterized protein YndB with AHSA1/START domain
MADSSTTDGLKETPMPPSPDSDRVDTGSRVIPAPADTIYRAFLDPVAVAAWRAPRGMRATVLAFDPREGGGYRMVFEYAESNHAGAGKTSATTDAFEGRFVELFPDTRIVEEVVFESNDPAFAGTMTITTTLSPVDAGTKVTVACSNVPTGIRPEDHAEGIASSLENLAAFIEGAGR